MFQPSFQIEEQDDVRLIRLRSDDRTNRLSSQNVRVLTGAVESLACEIRPLVITGSEGFFSVGADLNEIAALNGPDAYEFSRMGQALMAAVESFPAPVYAAVSGYCMGGGLDLALACHRRIAAPSAVFGHRGAALGLMTGWGGTQRLPRLIGQGRALQMFAAADKIFATEALQLGLIDAIADNPVAEALRRLQR